MAVGNKKNKISVTALLALVLSVCFVAALIGYFVASFVSTEHESAVYSTMEEPGFPVVYIICGDLEINPLKGYVQEMGSDAAETVSPLPSDRKLQIHIKKYNNSVAELSYEIRNLSLDHFIERTTVNDFTETKTDANTTLPIQNLIEKDTEYLLKITLDTGEKKINYYTRILWDDKDYAYRMLTKAKEFTVKTFDYEQAKELTQYMETDPAEDSSNLGRVTIGSSFTQLTWGQTGMHLVSEPILYLKEYGGMMSAVQVRYRSKMTEVSGEEEFNNVDDFTMRLGTDRIYIMNYRRETREIFSGSKHRFAGKKIMLGISGEDDLETRESENGQYIIFKTDKELWSFNQEDQKAVNVFSFRSKSDDGLRAGWKSHDIKIMSAENDGSLDFVVYGYMNRGRHEGNCGLVYYSYSGATGITTERFFVPFSRSYEKIKMELDELCTKGSSDMFYFKQNDSVIAVDLKSLEMMEVVTGLTDGTYLSNSAQTRFAWVENGRYASNSIKVMNISSGATQTFGCGVEEVFQLLTFSEDDLVLGRANANDKWKIGKRTRSLPNFRIEIYDEKLSPIMQYEKQGLYVDDFEKEANRFIFGLYRKVTPHSFEETGMDTIVCSETEPFSDIKRIGSVTSGEKQLVYYVSIDREIKNTKKLRISVPDSISYENSGNVEIRAQQADTEVLFYSWANGEMVGRSSIFSEALELCYDQMGWITDKNGKLLYNRTDRGTSYTIKEPLRLAQPLITEYETLTGNVRTEEGTLLIDAYDVDLNKLLCFVYKDRPVMLLNSDGTYILISGYDSKRIKLYYPGVDDGPSETKLVTREEADLIYEETGRNALCFVE